MTTDMDDLTWLVEACGTDPRKMAQLSIVLAVASIGDMVTADKSEARSRILQYHLLIKELERRVRQ